MRLVVPPIDAAATRGWDTRAIVTEIGGETMGTIWRVRLAPPPGTDIHDLHRLLQQALDTIVGEMSHWEPTSVLGRFNRAAPGSWTSLPGAFATVMAAALEVADRSGGAFDPAIGSLVDLWGFGPAARTVRPTDEQIRDALTVSGWQRLAFDRAARRLRQPGGLRLDLSGVAKGFAVDRLAAILAEQRIAHALVEVGGELSGSGMRPDGDPWWVDLETPALQVAPVRVALHQCAVATSGDYVRGRHTIDPRTGFPVEHALAVSVIHRSAMLADAWATALSVLGETAGERLAEAEGLAARIITQTPAGPREWISPALTEMVVTAA